jgi:hypothetical protein
MDFDLDEGLYIFEITLGYMVADSEHMTVPLTMKADDGDDAEEIVQEYLEINNLAGDFWIADITGPFDPEKYQAEVDEGNVGIAWKITARRIYLRFFRLRICKYRPLGLLRG